MAYTTAEGSPGKFPVVGMGRKHYRISQELLKFLFFLNKFIYLFLVALGLCCMQSFLSSCGERGILFIAVRGLLIAVASLVAEHGL